MRNPLCVTGRHEWRMTYDTKGQPFEICGRPSCYHARGHSRSDMPYTRPIQHLRRVIYEPKAMKGFEARVTSLAMDRMNTTAAIARHRTLGGDMIDTTIEDLNSSRGYSAMP